jgi:hypothetical protein
VPEDPPSLDIATSPLAMPQQRVVPVEPAPAELVDDAAVVAVTPVVDAPPRPNGGSAAPPPIDAGVQPLAPVEVFVKVSPASGSEWRLPGGTWTPVEGLGFTVPITDAMNVEVKNPCCQTMSVPLARDKPAANASLQFKPAQLTATCPPVVDDLEVSLKMEWPMAGKLVSRNPALGSKVLIPFETDATSSIKTVTVSFNNGVKSDVQEVTVSANKQSEVKCNLK